MIQQNTQAQPHAQAVQGATARAGSPSLTQVQALARYAARATFDDLSPASRQQLPVHMLDSLGCCIAALGAGSVQACHEQVDDFGGTDPCALIGGWKANPIDAALWHT